MAMSDILNVWHGEYFVGKLRQVDRGDVVFQYSDAWLSFPEHFAISHSLPLSCESFSSELSTAFFDNYLPEERLRGIVSRNRGLETHSTYALLKALGAECAGALTILPVDETPAPVPGDYKPLSYAELAQYIAKLPNQPLMGGQEEIRLSLAGAQSKGAVRISSDMRFFLPRNGAPSTHIIKPGSSVFPNLPENELFCMGLASHLGLDVPPVFLTPTLPKAFVIARYDRRMKGDLIERLHQEDFCQALGLYNSQKYQREEQGVSLSQCFALLSYCQNPDDDTRKLLQWVLFNVCIGNADAHAKNISLLYDGDKPHLAPFYDLVSSAPYPGLSQKLAIKIGNKYDADHLYCSTWRRFANDIGIEFSALAEIGGDLVTHLYDRIDALAMDFIAQYAYVPELGVIVDVVKHRAPFLLQEWGKED